VDDGRVEGGMADVEGCEEGVRCWGGRGDVMEGGGRGRAG
jgi:hypothetical protein